MKEHEKPWEPLSVDEVSYQFSGASFPWWIAGGLAIELAVDKTLRIHSDIDVLVLRRDQVQVRELLRYWDCWVAESTKSRKRAPLVSDILLHIYSSTTKQKTYARKIRSILKP